MNISSLFEKCAAERPDQPAIIQPLSRGSDVCTFAQLRERNLSSARSQTRCAQHPHRRSCQPLYTISNLFLHCASRNTSHRRCSRRNRPGNGHRAYALMPSTSSSQSCHRHTLNPHARPPLSGTLVCKESTRHSLTLHINTCCQDHLPQRPRASHLHKWQHRAIKGSCPFAQPFACAGRSAQHSPPTNTRRHQPHHPSNLHAHQSCCERHESSHRCKPSLTGLHQPSACSCANQKTPSHKHRCIPSLPQSTRRWTHSNHGTAPSL